MWRGIRFLKMQRGVEAEYRGEFYETLNLNGFSLNVFVTTHLSAKNIAGVK